MNAKAERKERSHETILDSAARLLRERGINGARVADVMAGAGLTVGGFYAHFASKEALVDETLRRTASELRHSLFRDLDTKPLADRALVVLKRYLSPLHRDRSETGCPFPAVVGEVGTAAPQHRAILGEQVAAMIAGVEEQLATAPPPGLTRRHLAVALVALMYGGLSLARALKGSPLSDEVIKACRALGASVVGH
jgi:TetR/AcrR family transcriptional repressor of nem operon